MRSWRVVAVGAVLSGWLYAAACGSDSGKRAIRDDAGGAGGAETTDGGAAGAPSVGGSAGAESGGDAGAPGTDGGSPGAGAVPGSGGAPTGEGGAGAVPGTQLTSCDAPIVVDDAAAANIEPDQATIVQGAGGPTLLVWHDGNQRKGRVLTGNTLGKVFTFPDTVAGSEYYPHYAASGAGRLVYTTPNTSMPSLSVYDPSSDSWTTEDHDGLYWELNQFLANGDTLHVVTNYLGSIGSLQVRSKAGVWGTAAPLYSIAPDRIYISQLLIDSQDRGAFIAGTGQSAPALMGFAIRNGVVVAETSLPIDVGAAFTEVFSALLPNGDVLVVYQSSADTVIRAVTFSYDEDADEASFDEPVELELVSGRIYGLAVDSAGDATLSYALAGPDLVRRRIDGVWGEPTPLSASDGWFADPVVDASGTAFVARASGDTTGLHISSSAPGSFTWSEPLDVRGDIAWTYPQRPRLGIHDSGAPMVIWTGGNPSGGRDILLSVCH
jgi:hypothetical protein